jgi:hypothetical protein
MKIIAIGAILYGGFLSGKQVVMYRILTKRYFGRYLSVAYK